MTREQQASAPQVDYRPFIIADADTGHGGEAHVRNLIRRFVEIGVPGYHIEDQKPGVKKCGHQGGKVLVPVNEQIQRLNAARFQLDVMRVSGIIVARTDAEAANLLDGCADERDQPFILGANNISVPSYKAAFLELMNRLFELGIKEIKGQMMFAPGSHECESARNWIEKTGLLREVDEAARIFHEDNCPDVDSTLDRLATRFVEVWQEDAGLKTFGQAVAEVLEYRTAQGETFEMNVRDWMEFSKHASLSSARRKATSMGITVSWDCELARTSEGYYQVQGGLEYAIAKSLAVAPFADLLWMETNTANLEEARSYAEAIHAVFPDKMLAYNLSPSFNWDTTGMSEEEMQRFPEELGKLGFVFNFITYGGHQIDGLAAEEFASALKQHGMLALARLQRKLRLLESPYRTPQTLVGGPRLDAALMAASGRTATTKAMGKGSTQHQHLVQTEVPVKVLDKWFLTWDEHNQTGLRLRTQLRPATADPEFLELSVWTNSNEKALNVVFNHLQDRLGHSILYIRDQNTLAGLLHPERLVTLAQLFLFHRYNVKSVHYLSPSDDDRRQASQMEALGIFMKVNTAGSLIVAHVGSNRIEELVSSNGVALAQLIATEGNDREQMLSQTGAYV
jgi:isocitrate lyase